ncbi:hypothetical protein [Frankia sp. R43]|uniref:hypothetical protein n=1 Tax=Frankia sp. R43 TaxID=269536 RepID=UPI000A5E2A24|nr:hypothetical protein [Frankia sp. R43]
MRRHWSARVMIGTALVLAACTGSTAAAMAAGPAGTGTPESGTAAPGAPALPPGNDDYTRCLKENGAQVQTESAGSHRRTVRLMIDSERGSKAVDACQQYAPAPGAIGGPPSIEPLTAEQNATVTKCLQDAGVTFPAPGTTQVLGLPPADGPVVAGSGSGPTVVPGPGESGGTGSGGAAGSGAAGRGGPVLHGEWGSEEGPVLHSDSDPDSDEGPVFVGEAGPGDGPAPGLPDAPDPKVTSALGQCAQEAGLPGLALETRSADGTTTSVVVVSAARE